MAEIGRIPGAAMMAMSATASMAGRPGTQLSLLRWLSPRSNL